MNRSHPETHLIRESADFAPDARRDERAYWRYVSEEQRRSRSKAALAGAEGFPDGF
jgi:hypothetical protein